MTFDNLVIKRIAVHEIFQRNDRALITPAFATKIEVLGDPAMDVFRQRITEALSVKALEMTIAKHGPESFLASAEAIETSSDVDFLAQSNVIAIKLANAQITRNIPGGMLMVFDGTVTAANTPFTAVLKAETQSGFRRTTPADNLQFFNDLFLTPTTRLYKVGIMLHRDAAAARPSGWDAYVFDHNISAANREAAAIYFYDTFLGCALKSDGPYETVKFFDLTKSFIKNSSLDQDQVRNVMDSLYVFVRDVQSSTFTAAEFGTDYLPVELRDDYRNFLNSRRFTENAVVRDISMMGTRLKRRKYKFGAGVELSVSAEARDKVTFNVIAGEAVDGISQTWTQIVIKDILTGEA